MVGWNGDGISIELCLDKFEGQVVGLTDDELELWSGEHDDRCESMHVCRLGCTVAYGKCGC